MGSEQYPKERLGKVASLIMGQSPPGSTYNEAGQGLPFFQGVKDFGFRHPTKRVYCTAPIRFAESGDILFSVRAPIGEINRAVEPCSIGRGLAVIRGKTKQDTTFIEYILRHTRTEWEILESQGAVFGNARKSDLQNLSIPWPEEVERKAIAHILGSLDDKIELNRRMNQTLEAMARAIFKHWFIDFEFPNDNGEPYKSSGGEMIDSPLGPIPKGWEVRRLIELSQFIGRGIAPKYDDEGEFVIINQRCIRDKTIDFRNSRRSSKGSSKVRKLQFGDMLINSTGVGTLGRVAQLREAINNCTVDSHVTIVRPIAELDTNYFGLAMENLEPYFEDLGIGTTGQTELGRVTIGETLFLFPKENIQRKFSNTVDPLRRASQQFQQTNDVLAELRDTLLPKLMSGEIRVPVSEKEDDQL